MPSRRPLVSITAAFLVLLAGANLATPLYPVYRERFHFSALTLTLVFATYAVVLVPSLVVFGQVSDRFGRRRVIAAGLGVAALALLVFALAQNTAWLFAARALQGLAVGAISGTATAALVEVEPTHEHGNAALAAALAQAGGSSLGPITAGVLAEWAPLPRMLCYLVGMAAALAAAIAVLACPEPPHRTGAWRLQIPVIPDGEGAAFARAALTASAVWSVAALFFAVGPTYSASLLSSHNLVLLAAIATVMLATSCVAQVVALRRRPAPATIEPLGLLLLALGLGTLVAAFPLHSLALLLLAGMLAGAGHGLGFLGSQIEINILAPDERRGEVTAAFVTVIYLGVAISVIGVGLLSERFSLFVAFAVFAAAISAVALATAASHVAASR
jgi:MFS family permease